MGKYSDRYFTTDPWKVSEEGFDPSYNEVAESVFSLGNEYMGLRGYFDEGYSGPSLIGSYLNGVYERRFLPKSGYKGMLEHTEFMVNSVDWTYLRLLWNENLLDLHVSEFINFERSLDLKRGLLTRSFIWKPEVGHRIKVSFERFLSMESAEIAGQEVRIEVLEGTGNLKLIYGLDFSNPQQTMNKNFWHKHEGLLIDDAMSLQGTTLVTEQSVKATCRCRLELDDTLISLNVGTEENLEHVSILGTEEKKATDGTIQKIVRQIQMPMKEAQILKFRRLTYMESAKESPTVFLPKEKVLEAVEPIKYEEYRQETGDWWTKQWSMSDVAIEGDPVNQQGIRFCIFQMHQTLHTAEHSAVIGAKGLTGEAYNGNTFWDSEVYCLPFYLFNNPQAAKSILSLRYDTLDEAKARAHALDCEGAFYPIATISGSECCDLWQHANLQLQASTAVAYGLWHYVHVTGDRSFLYDKGVEMLVEISRMLASRGNWNGAGDGFGFYNVMGPDEFQMMVSHNTYTNYLGKKTLEYTIDTLKEMAELEAVAYERLCEKLDLRPETIKEWGKMAEKMIILYDEDSMLFEQHQGYYDLPHLDIHSIPVEEFPLYSHWAYDRIYRNDMIKQPDVLMFMLMYNQDFTNEQLKANFDFYEPRCIHESSLSPSVHSILATQIGEVDQAFDFFGFATRMDLDNYNRNTNEGLHTTSIAGAWMNIVYGFGGLRSDGDLMAIAPVLPKIWENYSFKIQVDGSVLEVKVLSDKLELTVTGGPVRITLYGEEVVLSLGTEERIRPLELLGTEGKNKSSNEDNDMA